MFRKNCLVCGSLNLSKIIDLGMHPFADTFIHESRLSESEPVYPLSCDLCPSCGQIQTSCITNPKDRYSLHDYSYTSSNSSFSRNHWINYAEDVLKLVNLPANSFIVEVGSNDGFLTEQFQQKGHRVLGVDPSEYVAKLAKSRGVDTLVDLFTFTVSEKILKQFGKVQLVVANNVFNHADAPIDFAAAAANLLAPDGIFVFESPYWVVGLQEQKFDQIYHEHVSYITAKSAVAALEKVGLKVFDIEVVDYHGGSLRVFAKKKEDIKISSANLELLLAEENRLKIFSVDTYKEFMEDILKQRNTFLKKLYDLKLQSKSILAVGAAAKGNTFLNFYNLDRSIIDCVTDSSPHKCGKFTPLTRIPICGDDTFSDYGEAYALILSWNISGILKENLKKINPNLIFISPYEKT